MYSEKTLTDKVQRFLRPNIGANILRSGVSETTCRSNLTTTERFCEQEIEQEFKKQNKKLWNKIDKNRKKALYDNMFRWVIHSSFWLYQFVRHLGEMHEAFRRFIVFFLAQIRPKSEVKSWRRHSWLSQWNYAQHYFIAPYVMSCAMDARAHFWRVPDDWNATCFHQHAAHHNRKGAQINWTEEQTDQSIHVWWKCSNV